MIQQQVIQVGNSLAVTIPKDIIEKFSWKKGQKVYLTADPTEKIVKIRSKTVDYDNGLTPEFFAWKEDVISKNKALLTRLAKFNGK